MVLEGVEHTETFPRGEEGEETPTNVPREVNDTATPVRGATTTIVVDDDDDDDDGGEGLDFSCDRMV